MPPHIPRPNLTFELSFLVSLRRLQERLAFVERDVRQHPETENRRPKQKVVANRQIKIESSEKSAG